MRVCQAEGCDRGRIIVTQHRPAVGDDGHFHLAPLPTQRPCPVCNGSGLLDPNGRPSPFRLPLLPP